jgi:thiamine pyrophosphokinase
VTVARTKAVRKMSQVDHFRVMEMLLVGLLLGYKPSKNQVAKIIHIDDQELSFYFPKRKIRKKSKDDGQF